MPTIPASPEVLVAAGALTISAAGYRFIQKHKHGTLNSVVGILSVVLMGIAVLLILNVPK